MCAADHPKPIKATESREAAEREVVPSADRQTSEGRSRARVTALPWSARPRGFARVPTHVVEVTHERRLYPRAALRLPLRVKRVAGQRELVNGRLLTKNISSSGVYFFCPLWIEPGTSVDLEVELVSRPRGRGNVFMIATAQIVRMDPSVSGSGYGAAAAFDDITFHRDDALPPRFRQP